MSTDTLDIDSPVVYELGDMVIQPYDYQWKAVKAALREFETVNSTLIVMPTGSGKTETALFKARVVIEEGGRVLFLAHTDELVSQPVAKAIPIGMTAVREKAGDHACPHFTRGEGASLWGEVGDPKLVVGSVQTLQGKRLKSWPKGHFDLIIRDEAHHAYSPSDRAIVDHFEPKWYLGMTATPDRGDGNPIVGKGQPFETLAYEYSMTSAVEEGFLARPMFQCLDTEIDLSSLRPNRKDYNAEDLAEVLQPHIEELVSELVPKLEGRRAIIFVPMVCTAQAVASAFQSLVVAAEWISGESENRSDIIEDFKAGRHQHLVNAMVLTEGFDARFVDTVVILRATKSRALFVQMAGRCLRTYPGKQEGLILGVRWKTFKHKLVHPTQIFDTTRGPVANEAPWKALTDYMAAASKSAAGAAGE